MAVCQAAGDQPSRHPPSPPAIRSSHSHDPPCHPHRHLACSLNYSIVCRIAADSLRRQRFLVGRQDLGRWQIARYRSALQIRTGHQVVYDRKSDAVIRSIHVAGTLSFATDRDTELNVGLIKIQPGNDASEDGFNCDAHPSPVDPTQPKPALPSVRRISPSLRNSQRRFACTISKAWTRKPAPRSFAAVAEWTCMALR